MLIIPIACTGINWEDFVNKCQTHIGRSPTRSLDQNNLPVGSLVSFLSALNEFEFKDSNPKEINKFTLNHISITFLMLLDNWVYFSILEKIHKNIDIIKCQDYGSNNQQAIIMTGSLREWKESIIDFNTYTDWSLEIWRILHKMGFGKVFIDYKINLGNIITKR